ncbi:MAG TPA: copper-binding protein [Vicinamibacterales bacterium]|nr:copper-binding protein [Vicinamibacterales bacterium]
MFRRLMAAATAAVCALALTVAVSAQQKQPPAGKKDHAFKGKVEKVDPKNKMVTVNNENIPGWMMSMTMSYHVDKDAVLNNLKAGDQITATVYDGDFQTLYNVKVAPPKK